MEEGVWGSGKTGCDDSGVEFHASAERGVSGACSKKGTKVAAEEGAGRVGWPFHMKERQKLGLVLSIERERASKLKRDGVRIIHRVVPFGTLGPFTSARDVSLTLRAFPVFSTTPLGCLGFYPVLFC